ncbi:MAG: hypothetical protein H6Q41_2434 [Deltaproteobacteria bacterium]|jgi:hypothetical protein|nr:hypothetical protein [Deltaproteobacteria bacterium]
MEGLEEGSWNLDAGDSMLEKPAEYRERRKNYQIRPLRAFIPSPSCLKFRFSNALRFSS